MTTSVATRQVQSQSPTTVREESSHWRGIYLWGASASIITVLLTVLDITVSMMLADGDIAPGTLSVLDWFNLFATDSFRAFRDLGILNIINLIISIPITASLYVAHRDRQASLALIALLLFLFGGAIYISNNTVFALYSLSQEYLSATSEAQRLSLLSAGEAMLARGADFTPGTIVGFILPSLANMLMAYVLLQGNVFNKATGYSGLIGFTGLLIFTVWVTFSSRAFNIAMIIAMISGIAVMLWNIMIARRLFQLANTKGQS